jgi:hypothetical protein
MFLNAAQESITNDIHTRSLRFGTDQLTKYLTFTPGMKRRSNRFTSAWVTFMEALMLFHDCDRLFNQFMKDCRFETISKAAGLKMKMKNTIVAPWPRQLKKNATEEEFEIVHASNNNGSERYVEWRPWLRYCSVR